MQKKEKNSLEKENRIKTLFKTHGPSFPKIKKELGFSALSSIDLSSIPWPLYVMALSKNLIPDSEPSFFESSINCKEKDRELLDSMDEDRITCNICLITFKADEKDQNGMSIIQNVSALYKLHKSVSHMLEYPLCLACFYALQNPDTSADYPKGNRKDPNSEEYYTHTFQMLKRKSVFGYLGEIKTSSSNNIVAYVAQECAICKDDDLYGPDMLNIKDYAQ
jgi:hypothetical protein